MAELLIKDKLSPAEFRGMYRELTGDTSTSINQNTKEVDERIAKIMKLCDSSVLRDLRVNNGAKSSFDRFWDIVEKTIVDKTAVDDWRHAEASSEGDVVVNMSLAISVRDLHDQCKEEAKLNGLLDEDMLVTISILTKGRYGTHRSQLYWTM